jgi:hypothetical protein
MLAYISGAGRVAVLCIGFGALTMAAADAKSCSAPNPKAKTPCVVSCQFGCGVHVDNRTGVCSRYCFDRNGRMLDNVRFNALGQQIIAPAPTPTPTPVKPPTPSGNPPTPNCPPGGGGSTPFDGGCIKVKPPVAKSTR